MKKNLSPIESSLNGELTVPGDKSISHRSIIFGAISEGQTKVTNFLTGEDCLSTIRTFRQMGINIEQDDTTVTIEGKGLYGLKESTSPIDFGNSGTTARLVLGVLAGLNNHQVLIGDDSLSKRPMDRVAVPLREMGATIDGRQSGKYLPISIRGGTLSPITYTLPVNSAQVKSAVLLAGLYGEGKTGVVEPVPTRDHTERMIKAFSGNIAREGNMVLIDGQQKLKGTNIEVPGDISSAAYFLAAAAIIPGSHVMIKNVGLNPTRTGIIDVLQQMGASMEVTITKHVGDEPVGNIEIKGSSLVGTELKGDLIPRLIDEIPIIALVATQAEGKTTISDAEELRVKETDRVKAVVDTLNKIGANIEGKKDGMIITGKTELSGGSLDSFGDHRIGMMISIAALITKEKINLENWECISISYPNFYKDLESLIN